MGCLIDEVAVHGDSVTVWAEGQCITFVLSEGKLVQTAFSENYFGLFRFRPLCQIEHKEAALKAFSEINQKTPTVKKQKRRKKKVKVSKYAINEANLVSDKLRDRQFWNTKHSPIDENGEYTGVSFEEIIKMIREKVREQYRISADKGEKANHQRFVLAVLDEIGCFDYWSRGRIFSYLSKLGALHRKEKKEVAKKRVLKDAEQAEHAHQLSIDIN